MTPIELLQKELDENKRALEKSNEMFENHIIDTALHETHYRNLIRVIREYESAIRLLTQVKNNKK